MLSYVGEGQIIWDRLSCSCSHWKIIKYTICIISSHNDQEKYTYCTDFESSFNYLNVELWS